MRIRRTVLSDARIQTFDDFGNNPYPLGGICGGALANGMTSSPAASIS